MKLRMSEGSLFAILLRSAWWVSLLLGLAVAAAARAIAPPQYAVAAMLGATPFVVIAAIAFARQWRTPSTADVQSILPRLQGMAWKDFSALLQAGLVRDGYAVTPLEGGGEADFKLVRGGRTLLVAARKFKARSVGADNLRGLAAQRGREDASEAWLVTLVVLADTARAAAAASGVKVVEGVELVRLVKGLPALR